MDWKRVLLRTWLVAALIGAGCTLNTRGEQAVPPDGHGGASGTGGLDASVDGHGGSSLGGQAGHGGAPSSGGKAGAGGGVAGSSGSGAQGGNGGAAGNGGQGGATGGASGTAGSAGETCTDGVDNDNNGATDCADDACTAEYHCEKEVPTGWEGYFWARSQDYAGAQNTPCPGSAEGKRVYVGPAGAAQCAACSCKYAPGECSVPPLVCAVANTCSPALVFSASGDADICVALPISTNKLFCRLGAEPQVAKPGTCGPTGAPDFSNKDPFATVIDTCRFPTGKGCAAGQSCAPIPQAPFGAKPCLVAKGEGMTCPTGFDLLATGWGSYADTRGCSACGCTTAGESCTITYHLKDHGSDCSGSEKLVNSAVCTDVSSLTSGNATGVEYPPDTAIAAGCAAPTSGGAPTGDLARSEPLTICCKH